MMRERRWVVLEDRDDDVSDEDFFTSLSSNCGNAKRRLPTALKSGPEASALRRRPLSDGRGRGGTAGQDAVRL